MTPRTEATTICKSAVFGLALLLPVWVSEVRAEAATYPSPEAAAEAFVEAVASPKGQGLLDLFGAEHEEDIIGGDPAEARQNLETLRRAVAGGVSVVDDDQGRKELVVGRNGWPMPVPLVEGDAGWSFDVDAGIEEINLRRIGRHELAAIETCRAYMDAQAEYAAVDRDGDRVREFAQRLASSPGTRDGLYWDESAGTEESPLGPFVAASEQYLDYREVGEPFRGYMFRVLTEQGENPPGGEYEYIINDNMIAGHALAAWPADYGRSGIMTFLCSHHGEILEKDLGEDTAAIMADFMSYDPDETWFPAE